MDKENLTVLDIEKCMRKFVDAEVIKAAYGETDKKVSDFATFNEEEAVLKMIGIDISVSPSSEYFMDGSREMTKVAFRAGNYIGPVIGEATIYQDVNGQFSTFPDDLNFGSEAKNKLQHLLDDYYNPHQEKKTNKVLYFKRNNFSVSDIELSQKGVDMYKYYSGYEGEIDRKLKTPGRDGTYVEQINSFGKTRKLLTRHDPVLIKIVEIFGHEVFEPFDEGGNSAKDFDIIIENVPESGYYLWEHQSDWRGSEYLMTEKDFSPVGGNKALLFEDGDGCVSLSKRGLTLYKQYSGYSGKICPDLWPTEDKFIARDDGKVIDRNDPALIKVVEQLGRGAFTSQGFLYKNYRFVDIPSESGCYVYNTASWDYDGDDVLVTASNLIKPGMSKRYGLSFENGTTKKFVIEEKPAATKQDRIIPKTAPVKAFNGSPVMTAEMYQGTMREAKEKAAQTAEPRTAIKDSSMKGDLSIKGDLSMKGEALILEINDSSGGGRDDR